MITFREFQNSWGHLSRKRGLRLSLSRLQNRAKIAPSHEHYKNHPIPKSKSRQHNYTAISRGMSSSRQRRLQDSTKLLRSELVKDCITADAKCKNDYRLLASLCFIRNQWDEFFATSFGNSCTCFKKSNSLHLPSSIRAWASSLFETLIIGWKRCRGSHRETVV